MPFPIKKINKPIIASEFNECLCLVDYLKIKGIKFAHIHNEMWTNSWKQKNKAKSLGVSSGVPDYLICLPNKLLFIEMKREKNGQVSENQKEWIELLNRVGGNVEAIICRGFDEAKNYIENYLKLFKAKKFKIK